jgi:hypothetical protein
MLPYLIGAGLGGLTGGVSAYQKRGDIGEALLGAGIGAGLGAGSAGLGSLAGAAATRFAGQALGPLATGSSLGALQAARQIPLLGKLIPEGASLAQQAAMGSKIVEAAKAAPKVAGALAGTGAGLAATSLVAPTAAAAAGVGRKVARGALGLGAGAGIPAMQPGGQFDTSGAVPGGLPVGASPYNTLDIVNPAGPFGAMRTAGLLEGDVQLANMKKMMPYLFQAAEARSKTEMQRQLTAAGVRQNIATAANMLERSQQAAQQMGINAASQAGSALTSQYQYQ